MKRGRADIFPRHIIRGMGVGLLLISSSWYSRTCLLNGLRCHAFRFLDTTISFIGTGKEALKQFIMSQFTFTLNFPNGNVQTYPDAGTMTAAAKAMGGEAKAVNTSGPNKIYAFVPKK